LRFIGCALAWRPGEAREKTSCLVVLDERGSIIANSFVGSAEEIAGAVDAYGSERRGVIVGVDAPLAVPNERGNSSYQAANAARGRSTQSGWGGDDEQLGDLGVLARRRWRVDEQGRRLRGWFWLDLRRPPSLAEGGGEDPVVDGHVLGSSDEGGAPGPVDGTPLVETHGVEGGGEGQGAVEGRPHAGAPQRPRHHDRQPRRFRRNLVAKTATRRRRNPGGAPGHHIPRRTADWTRAPTPLACTRSWSSRYFSTVPSVAVTAASSSEARPRVASACAQSIVSATPGGL